MRLRKSGLFIVLVFERKDGGLYTYLFLDEFQPPDIRPSSWSQSA
jgi:hypothetical protein